VITISTLVLIIRHYYYFGRLEKIEGLPELLMYFLVPLCITCIIFKELPAKYGLKFGKWKHGLLAILISLFIMAIIIWIVAKRPDFQRYYRLPKRIDLTRFLIENALYMFAWEFLFRGYMLFGLEEHLGVLTIFVQSVPFTITHLGKPALETISTLFGGYILGFISYKTRSFLPCFIIHLGVYILMCIFANPNLF